MAGKLSQPDPMAWMLVLVLVPVCGGCDNERPVRDARNRIIIEYWHQPMVTSVPGLEEVTREPGDFERHLAREFMRRHPDIVIRTQCLSWEDLPRKVPISVLGGRPPDVLMDYVGRTSGYWYQGVLEPVDEVLAGQSEDFQQKFLEAFRLEGSGKQRRLHAVPLCGWVQLLAINRAAWDKSGMGHLLPTSADPRWTWPQFEAALAAVAKPGQRWPLGLQVASEQGDYRVLQYFWAFGAEIYQQHDFSRVTINSPQGVAALQWLVDAHARGWIQPNVATAGNSLYDMFWRGDICCIPSGISMRGSFAAAVREKKITADFDGDGQLDFDLMFTLPPTRPDCKLQLPFGAAGIAVFRQPHPEKRRAVFEFVRFLSQTDVVRKYARASNQIPSRKSVGDVFAKQADVRLVASLAAACDEADMGATSPHYYNLRKRLPPQLQFAFLGLKTPAQALADFEREAQVVLRASRRNAPP
jgi:multiple sugar transport system substrate-binding protein